MPVKLSCVASPLPEVAADLLAVGVFSSESITSVDSVASLDRALNGALKKLIAREEFTGKKEQALELDTLGQLPAQRLVLIGLGDRNGATSPDVRAATARAARTANATKATSMAIFVDMPITAAVARAVGEGIHLGAYRFIKYMTGERRPKAELRKAQLVVPAKPGVAPAFKTALELGAKIGQAVCRARDLINEPPNELTPVALANYAAAVAQEHHLDCRVFDKRELKKMGLKLLLAVAQGSANEPRLVHITYKPAKPSKKKIVLVGKGLTFDSGGLSIKPAAGMHEMKDDMAGAANVVAFMAAVSMLKPKVEVHGIIGTAENMPDGNAYRPGDVFGSLDGKSVEIINTDAEGRLVLADALAYAKNLSPSVLLCNATLTGACVVALGQRCAAYYSTSEELAEQFRKAADVAGEQFWRLPFLEDLKDQLKSDVADLKHTGDRWGGSITAALFLREFVGDAPFIHCDIAGPALTDKPYRFYTKGGTGQGVLTFLEFVESY